MHVGMSDILRERNDLDGAREHLRKSGELGDENGLPQNRYRSRVAMARTRQAEGSPGDGLELLAEAERQYVSDFFPNVRPVAALTARVWIAQGRLSEAWGWARENGLSAVDDLSYAREFEHITLAKLLAAEADRDRAGRSIDEGLELLERLLPAAEEGGRTGSVIEILVVRALAERATGDTVAALGSLEQALVLAEPEGYVRIVADEGPPMAALLKLAVKRRDTAGYMRRLLAAAATAEGRAPAEQSLIEPLSERELEVLRLLQSDLDGPEIARELTVSLNTVRTHTKNIYAKLGVNSRRAAVHRAAELGLLARTGDRRPTA